MFNRLFIWFGMAILLAATTRHSRADTNAFAAYNDLDEMFQPISAVDANKLEIHVIVGSTNKAVHPADIRLTVQSAKGVIPLLIDTNGVITGFPHTKELARENPPVIANQPKGSMRLWVAIQIPPSDELAFPYRRLGDGIAEMNKSIKAQAGLVMSLLAPKVDSVVFLFPKTNATNAKVVIESTGGKKEYAANTNGVVRLKLEKVLLAENPQVRLSVKPRHIVPDMSSLQ